MNNHPREESISALVDGMLDVAETKQVLTHVRACAACRDTFETFATNKALARSSSTPAVPSPEFWTQTFRRLRTEVDAPSAPRRNNAGGLFAPAYHRRWGAAMAAVMAVGVAIILPMTQTNTSPKLAPIALQNAADSGSDVLDVSYLVRAHTDSVARQPLSDPDRQHMISQQADQGASTDYANPEAALYADSAL